jgi:hypothetical protein
VALTIDYRLTGAGWAACTISQADATCEITASYLSDAFGKLVLAAASIAAGAHGVSVGFDEEPGEYRWLIRRLDDECVQVTILSFPDWFPYRLDDEGEAIFRCTCTPLEFARAVMNAALALRESKDDAVYLEQWDHAFPAQALNLLESHVAVLERPHGQPRH